MLEQLIIRNVAIIGELETRLRPGFNVLSGETGAGKSIIVNAVNLILGGRAFADLIRTGMDEARVEALFRFPPDSALSAVMADLDIPFDGEILITRTISREGRNTVRINGALATVQMLSRLSPFLISISGQHEHQRLLRPENHLMMLDAFGGLDPDRMDLAGRYAGYVSLRSRRDALEREIRDMEEKRELARFQQEEIQAAAVEPGEDDRLDEERTRLRHAEELRAAVGDAYQAVYERDASILSEIARCERRLERAAQLDRRIEPAVTALSSARTEIEEAALCLRDVHHSLPMDPKRLDEVEERIQLLKRLKRKYGPTLDDVLARAERLGRQMDDLEELRLRRDAARKELGAAEEDLLARAVALSCRRRQAAADLADAAEQELSRLAMKGTRFRVRFDGDLEDPAPDRAGTLERLGPDGIDRVEFMLSPNVGEEMRPLARIASGGELSRIMLALKTLLASNASVETVVFDEVDAGIGGEAAETVGEKLRHLAQYHQVLCITHLPQIACRGEAHFRVAKMVRGRRTEASITELDREERVKEIARLLGGKGLTPKAMDHAREMLEGGATAA